MNVTYILYWLHIYFEKDIQLPLKLKLKKYWHPVVTKKN